MKKCLGLAAILLLVSTSSWAIERYVPSQYASIQAAVDAANSGDVIIVAPGTYSDNVHQPPADTTRCVVVMKSGITLRGYGTGRTIIDVNGRGRGIYCSGVNNAVIEDLTVREAFAAVFGAGILCRAGSNLTIRNCEVTACTDGGIICLDSSPAITNCWLTNNAGKQGGGLSIEVGSLSLGSSPQVRGCMITGNQAPSGGGVFVSGFSSHPTFQQCYIANNFINLDTGNGGGVNATGTAVNMSDCSILNNTANGTGGGFNTEEGQITLTNCLIQGNTTTTLSSGGGGFYAGYNSDIILTDCTVTHNTALGTDDGAGGGGLGASSCYTLVLRQCTFARNSAANDDGGGVAFYGLNPVVDKCILAFNGPGAGMFCGIDAVPTVSCTDLFGNTGGDAICGVNAGFNFSQDPRFCNSSGDDYRLQAGSPCLPGLHPQGATACNGSRLGSEDQGCVPLVGVDELAGITPRLIGNEPNPFLESTTIRYELPQSGRVSLRVFDAAGRSVRVLLDEQATAGPHQAVWDGRADNGRAVPSGIYFYSLRVNGAAETRRMVLAR